ncbi:hypothetical protein QYE76_049828 [Lolium multiflorum]|uniref:RING-type domain-containing protein n=1 Tax=Lolium multiflorum TaxID=4521 RepID=A0AAD8SPU8_LOLMU|nr:hypothetical protein QYE76_049828 [Lolium multiflorum]
MSVSLVLTTVAAPSDGSDCAICLDNDAGTAEWKETTCRHSFHKTCLDKWLVKDKKKASCPVCRRKLTPFSESELDDVYPTLRGIIQRYGKHLLGDNYHKFCEREYRTTDVLYRQVVGVDQCLRAAGGLLAEALPLVACGKMELANAKLRDAVDALSCAMAAERRIPVDGRVLPLLPASESLHAAYNLSWTGQQHISATTMWLSTYCTGRRFVEAERERLAAVGDLEAALQEARAAVQLTSAALAGDSLRRLTVC